MVNCFSTGSCRKFMLEAFEMGQGWTGVDMEGFEPAAAMMIIEPMQE